jgi:hypothetical protein
MEPPFQFYSSFIELLKINSITPTPVEGEILWHMRSSKFRKYILNHYNDTLNIEIIDLFSKSLLSTICKPQRCIRDHSNYYIGCDMLTNTYYICYKNLLMIDLDLYKDDGINPSLENSLSQLQKYLDNHTSLKFMVYKSQGGLHLFEVSREWNYRDPNSINLMLELKCDFYYIVYSYLRGWSVRLNKKNKEISIINNKMKLYEYVGIYGKGNINSEMEKLVNIHIKLIPLFAEEPPSQIFGGSGGSGNTSHITTDH